MQEQLLFTEGRNGGDRTDFDDNDRKNSGEGYWGSEYGGSHDYNGETAGGKEKGDTIYDRSRMKFSKEGQRESKQGSKGGGVKDQGPKGQEFKDKGEIPLESYDDVEAMAPHQGTSLKPSSSKGSPKGDPGDELESQDKDVVRDEYYAPEENVKYSGKPNGKENGGESYPEAGPGPAPAQTPITAPDRHMPPDYTQVQMAQVAYVRSQFGLEFTIADQVASGVPTTLDFAGVEAATIGYLGHYLQTTYGADATIFFDSAAIEATSRRTGGTGGTPFIDFEASVAFAEDSPMTPTPAEIGQTISEAFDSSNLSAYTLQLSNELSGNNPFDSTIQVTVYLPDASEAGQGRVARSSTKMSAAGVAAAASTGVLTLLVGGYLLFKIRNENLDMKGKGEYAGGLTLAGDTYDNSTLDASATLPHDDAHSMDNSMYNDDGSFISSLPPAALKQPVDNANLPRIRTFEEIPERNNSTIASGEDSNASGDENSHDEEETFQDEDREVEAEQGNPESSSIVGRTRALVPTFKSTQHMSNMDIKNYFKSKYKCVSPDYDVVDQTAIAGVEPSRSDDQSLNLVLPALDHETSESVQGKQQVCQDYEGAYMRAYDDDQSLASTSPSDEGTRADDSFSVGNCLDAGSLHRLVATAQRKNRKSAAIDPNVVPRLPSEQRTSDHGETGSVDRHMDDVSLGTM